jgi:hypothetical protein
MKSLSVRAVVSHKRRPDFDYNRAGAVAGIVVVVVVVVAHKVVAGMAIYR